MAGLTSCRSRARRRAWSIWTIWRQARRQDGRLHDHQPQHAGPVRRADREIARFSRRGRVGVSRRRQHERHSGHHPAGRFRRRHDALQPAQDVQQPARRRRTRRGPIAVTENWPVSCPCPSWSREADGYRLDYDRPKSIGRVRSFFGNVGVLVRAYCYIRTHGPDGLRRRGRKRRAERQLSAGRRARNFLPCPRRPLHARVRGHGAKLKADRGISAMDIAKRLMDYGFHAADGLFPADRPRGDDDRADRNREQGDAGRLYRGPFSYTEEPDELLHEAPHATPVSRPDEVSAARNPILKWKT